MLEHDLWLTRRLFEAAASLPEATLHEGIDVNPGIPHDFEAESPSVLDMLERLVRSKEISVAAIAGRDRPKSDGHMLADLRGRSRSAPCARSAPRSPALTRSSGSGRRR